MFSIRKWIATKMFAQAAAASRASRRPPLLDGTGGHCSRTNFADSSLQGHTLLRFYYADEELNLIAAELDSFDGRKDPIRCTNLVNQLRAAQDKVISLLFQLMDEWHCGRSNRDYRQKFPDDLLSGGENGESLNGQIWFGAECLAAGSNIMNHEAESEMLRPTAKTLTNSLDQLRLELRHACTDIDDSFFVYKDVLNLDLTLKMEQFDRLFANFEYEYVKAMLPIKSAEEIEKLHELTVLFSEAVASALQRKLLQQEDIDDCQPHVMIAIPRLAIVYALTQCTESPLTRPRKEQIADIFKPFHNVLHRVRDLVLALRPVEVEMLEKMLTNEESVIVDCSKENLGEHVESNSKSSRHVSSHKRRHSAPDKPCSNSSRSPIGLLEKPTSTLTLTKCASTASLMSIITAATVEGDGTKHTCGGHSRNNKECQVSVKTEQSSTVSIDSTTTTSTVDSFELALALGAKNSQFISAGTKQLLHRLFVTIAGTADQLQSNCASDLRMILRNLFVMYGEIEDNVSVEEAFEVHEDACSASSSSTTSSGSSSSVTTPIAGEGTTFQNSLSSLGLTASQSLATDSHQDFAAARFSSLPSSSRSENYSAVRPSTSSSSFNEVEDRFLSQDGCIQPPRTSRRRHKARNGASESSNSEATVGRSSVLIAPVWVPDELVSSCTGCTLQFNLIRRRHHCRNCGQIYCRSCSNQSVTLAHFGFEKPVRVCSPCFLQYFQNSAANS